MKCAISKKMLIKDKFNTWINLKKRKSSQEGNDTTGFAKQTKIQTTSETCITAKSQQEIILQIIFTIIKQKQNNYRNNIESLAF